MSLANGRLQAKDGRYPARCDGPAQAPYTTPGAPTFNSPKSAKSYFREGLDRDHAEFKNPCTETAAS